MFSSMLLIIRAFFGKAIYQVSAHYLADLYIYDDEVWKQHCGYPRFVAAIIV